MISAGSVAEFVRARTGEVAEIVRLPGSVANQDFLVTSTGGDRVVIKVGPESELAAEAWACRRLVDLDLPVPEIIELDRHGIDGQPTLIMAFLPGAASEESGVLTRAGHVMRRVHEIGLPGWGPLLVAADHVRGQHDSWGAAIMDQLSGLPELVAAGVIDSELAGRARDHVAVPALLDYDGPGVLLHHDLKPAHVFAVDGRLTGIIDWGDAGVGDPLGDLARLSMTGPAALEAFAAGYGIEITAAVADTLARYRILWNVGALSYEHRAGGDWFDVYRTRIVDDLEGLG